MSAAIQTELTVQLRTVGFAGAVSSLPPRTNVSEGELTRNFFDVSLFRERKYEEIGKNYLKIFTQMMNKFVKVPTHPGLKRNFCCFSRRAKNMNKNCRQ